MTSKIILIGSIKEYQSKFNLINIEIKKGNLKIVGILPTSKSNLKSIDNIPLFKSPDELNNINFDYLITLNENKNLMDIISEQNLNKKIIPIRVFEIPYFDFLKYEKLIKNPPSIISAHCWGGLLYHELGLKFTSPFINLFMSDKDFNKLSKNLHYYMSQDLKYKEEGYEVNLKSKFPIATLGDLTIYFNHYSTFEEAKQKWDERKNRINYDNLFFETYTTNLDIAIEFDSLPHKHKLCFCMHNITSEDIINFSDFMKSLSQKSENLGIVVNSTANGEIPYFNLIDLLLNFNFKPRIKLID